MMNFRSEHALDVVRSTPVVFQQYGEAVFRVSLCEGRDDAGRNWRFYEATLHSDNQMLTSQRYGFCEFGYHANGVRS